VAITHNPAFARSLEATHVLRVRDGRVELAANFGLTAADFDHTAPAVPVAAAGAAAAGAAAGKAASARKVRSKLRAVRCAPSALAPADAGRHSQAVMFSGRGLTAQAPDCCQEALPALRHGHRRRRACGRPPWRWAGLVRVAGQARRAGARQPGVCAADRHGQWWWRRGGLARGGARGGRQRRRGALRAALALWAHEGAARRTLRRHDASMCHVRSAAAWRAARAAQAKKDAAKADKAAKVEKKKRRGK